MRSVLCVAAAAALVLSAPAAQAASLPKMFSSAWAKVTSKFKGDGEEKKAEAKAKLTETAAAAAPADALVLFSEVGLNGKHVAVTADTPNLRKLDFSNRARSLRIPAGESWELCSAPKYAGRCQVFTGEVVDLKAAKMDGAVSSVRKLAKAAPAA